MVHKGEMRKLADAITIGDYSKAPRGPLRDFAHALIANIPDYASISSIKLKKLADGIEACDESRAPLG